MQAAEQLPVVRRTKPTRALPPGWVAPSLESQAKAIAARYEATRKLRRSVGIRRVT